MIAQILEPKEIARKAHDIYDRLIRTTVETEDNIGKMITIDVDTGAYEIDDEMSSNASDRLRALNPNAELFGIRIGYKAAYSFGGSSLYFSPEALALIRG